MCTAATLRTSMYKTTHKGSSDTQTVQITLSQLTDRRLGIILHFGDCDILFDVELAQNLQEHRAANSAQSVCVPCTLG